MPCIKRNYRATSKNWATRAEIMMKHALLFMTFGAFFCASLYASDAENLVPSCSLDRTVTSTIKLTRLCQYKAPLVISKSNVTLDCNGALIDASKAKIGITVEGDHLRNVTIKNCRITGALFQGIFIRSSTIVSDLAKMPLDDRYVLAPSGVTIQNTSVLNSGSVGIYIGKYVWGTKIENSLVSHTGGAGIYIDASSFLSNIYNNTVSYNGYGDSRLPKKKGKREGIAIDSSAFNRVEDNKIFGNASGGVFLYKNCWENHQNPMQVQRWQHANFNLISRNNISDKIGVWVASRQAKRLRGMKCGDPEIAPGYYRDYSSFNTISDNTFEEGDIGVMVEDDQNTIIRNRFNGLSKSCVILGSKLRDTLLKKPIQGTSLIDNVCNNSKNGFETKGESFFASCKGNVFDGDNYACRAIQ